jgi:hypothetical protein
MGLWGFVNKQGALAIPAVWESAAPFGSGLAPVNREWRWGYVDPAGEVRIPLSFITAEYFTEGYALVKFTDDKKGYIDTQGKPVGGDLRVDHGRPFSNGVASFRKNDLWGFLDGTGVVIEPQFEDVGAFADGVAPAKLKKKWGLIDRKGTFVVPAKQLWLGPVSEGLVSVNAGGKISKGELKGGLWGALDLKGAPVIEPRFTEELLFVNGLSAACEDKKLWGFVDKTGEWAIPPKYTRTQRFVGGLASVNDKGKWGFIDAKGKQVIAPQHEWLGSPHEGLIAFMTGGKWGFMTSEGKTVIEPQFARTWYFSSGLAPVELP